VRDIKGRGETKGVGYVEAALYKKGLLNYVVNKKIDDYTRWPQPFKQQLIDTVANHQAFRKACGFTPNAAAHPDATVDLTWLAAFPESLALVMSFLEVTSKNKSGGLRIDTLGRSSDRHPSPKAMAAPGRKQSGGLRIDTLGRSLDPKTTPSPLKLSVRTAHPQLVWGVVQKFEIQFEPHR
jgi:hypothetical protein